jgi:plasmid stabilization system protein ParE
MFLVEWTDEAFDLMAGIVSRQPYRKQEFGLALRQIAWKLGDDPVGHSESRPNDARILSVKPLTIYFRVDEEAEAVEVFRVVLRM